MTLTLVLFMLAIVIVAGVGTTGKLYKINWIHSMKRYSWFGNPWLAGVFLLGVNVLLFGLTGLILFGLSFLMIPFIHLFIMLAAVVISILVWKSIASSCSWGKWDRLKTGAAGSSFYLILAIYFFYRSVSYVPQFPGDDSFMATLGFMIGVIVTGAAFLTCFGIVVFTKNQFTK
ncbi:hypothetical protein HP456_03770 [Bacillus haikouensis]|uniref:hypothetical protein n=1 Tax=Bacillus haikouensis TaxID=1510468 RepID=UPI001552A97A|nr:hypothetical protein [Bacillus haikouensis]NQD65032.1 hypothetical protein [Bacillus haikouensis]